jgi:hypothetical protein
MESNPLIPEPVVPATAPFGIWIDNLPLYFILFHSLS